MIIDQLTNIDHVIFNEDFAFAFLKNLSSYFHTLVVLFNINIDFFFYGANM
jgi:hypothetical protein